MKTTQKLEIVFTKYRRFRICYQIIKYGMRQEIALYILNNAQKEKIGII